MADKQIKLLKLLCLLVLALFNSTPVLSIQAAQLRIHFPGKSVVLHLREGPELGHTTDR